MHREYVERRRRVIDAMGQGTMIIFSAPTTIRNNDVENEYRQDSDFYYLTGLDEQDSVLVLVAGSSTPFCLFVRPRDPERETWDGERIGVDGALERFGANAAYSREELHVKLFDLLKGQTRLFYSLGRNAKEDELVLDVLRRLRERSRRGDKGPSSIIEPSTILHEMRLVKCPTEIEKIMRATEITAAGYRALFERTQPGMGEYELEGILRERYRALGAERHAFAPIVASGRNGRILHHRRNDRVMKAGELVEVDSGAEYGYLAADITRTFPVSGRYTDIQRRAYEIVLDAQEQAIASVRPGTTLPAIHGVAVRRLCSGLVELGILKGEVDELIERDAYKKYYMHQTSHWLGMDVHDVGDYFVDGKPRRLQPGMVFTVEPGLYFGADDLAVPAGLRDTGIRIEDNVLVTEQGYLNLSTGVLKSVRDIEDVMQNRSNR
jgi:Xaa-Pro aminopeptidase